MLSILYIFSSICIWYSSSFPRRENQTVTGNTLTPAYLSQFPGWNNNIFKEMFKNSILLYVESGSEYSFSENREISSFIMIFVFCVFPSFLKKTFCFIIRHCEKWEVKMSLNFLFNLTYAVKGTWSWPRSLWWGIIGLLVCIILAWKQGFVVMPELTHPYKFSLAKSKLKHCPWAYVYVIFLFCFFFVFGFALVTGNF